MVQQKLQINIHHLAKGYFVVEEQSLHIIFSVLYRFASIMQLITITYLLFELV